MNLEQASPENLEIIIEEIKTKLKVVSIAAIKSTHFDLNRYDELYEIYDVVKGIEQFSISEIEQLVKELGKLRNPNV